MHVFCEISGTYPSIRLCFSLHALWEKGAFERECSLVSGAFSFLHLKPQVALMSRRSTERDSEQGWSGQPAAETPNEISGSKRAGFCGMILLMPKVGISDWISQKAMDFTFCGTEWYFQWSQYELLLWCTSPCNLSTVQQSCTAGRRWGCLNWYPSFSFLDYLLLGQRGEKQHLTLFFFLFFFPDTED